jgi:hypothetical protein
MIERYSSGEWSKHDVNISLEGESESVRVAILRVRQAVMTGFVLA